MSIRILVVDDEVSIRAVLVRFLMREGYTVDACEGGDTALARLSVTPYDVLLTDMMMPGLSGLDLLAAARCARPALRCIVMSGIDLETKPPEVSWLEKPIDIDRLLSLLPPASGVAA